MSDFDEDSFISDADSEDYELEGQSDEEMDDASFSDALSSEASLPSSPHDSGFQYTHASSTPTNASVLAASLKGKGKAKSHPPDALLGSGAAAYQLTVDYEVFTVEQLAEQQKEAVDYIVDLLSLKESEAATLLRYFAWRKEKLVELYMDDRDRTLSLAGIHTGSTSSSSSQPRLKRVRGFTCEICYDDDGTKETLALSCDHRFCKDCYTQYVTSKIMDEGESRRIQCVGNKCKVIIDEATVAMLVTPDVLSRYKSLLNRTYVDDSPTLRWCPFPGCENAISCTTPSHSFTTTIPTVSCACGNAFCFGCGEADHRPCVCGVVRKWKKKCEDDSETSNWISANTKECTKCHSTIEKNGGCNHMTCKKCTWEFCWVCMGPWSEHGTAWYNCARYEEKGDTSKDSSSKSRLSLERYLHYYNRYANHEQSIKLEAELFARTEKKMEAMQATSGLSWIECQFLAKAVETLGKVRTVLKWTYAMAFYLEKNNQTQMFEDNQNDLEQAVESLAEMIERPLEEAKVDEMRQQTTDKTVYVSQRCRILLEDTLRGYEEERWDFHV